MAEPKDLEEIQHDETHYERRDANLRGVLIIAGVSSVILIVSLVVVWNLFIATREELVQEVVLAPESAALRELRTREDQVLYGYGLTDSAAGIYRIPIDRAMQLLAEEAYARQRGSE
ncbi:MAG: hypothetical protein C4524_00560 [Candidatus Zixiibacteriota bacterium]|nr:MAG: hypothetical protein C4524_00560 [candidate division Zixibacteria bacterium]